MNVNTLTHLLNVDLLYNFIVGDYFKASQGLKNYPIIRNADQLLVQYWVVVVYVAPTLN